MQARLGFLVVAIAATLAAASARGIAQGVSAYADGYFVRFSMLGLNLDGFLQQARRSFREADLNMDRVVDATDAKIRQEAWRHSMQSAKLADLLANDLDFDGVVTHEEVEQHQGFVIRRQVYWLLSGNGAVDLQQRIDDAVEKIMRADRNADDRLDMEEMLAFAREQQPVADSQGTLLYASIMTMDADRDGSVTAAEFDRGAEEFFRAVDADGNGILSKEEAVAFGERRAAQQQAALRQRGVDRARLRAEARHVACAMPKPTDAARVILQLLPQGDALSTVTLQSQDVVVTTGRLVIDAGDGPLYVILKSGGGTIWQLSGAVERIERLVLAESTTGPNKSDREQTPLAGVIGIAADRVTFLGRPDCIPDFFVPSEMAKGAAEVVRAAIGRAPTLIATYGEGMNIAVPSGQRSGPRSDPLELMVRDDGGMLHIERGPNRVARDDRDVQSSLRRFYENGIVEIDPAAVVASAPVERYTTLPQQAGLIQLVQSGALTEGRPSRPGFPLEFIVNRKIRFPAGLGGSASVKFVIAPGVPMPDGDPMHSCVMLQQTGKAVVNAQTCRYAN